MSSAPSWRLVCANVFLCLILLQLLTQCLDQMCFFNYYLTIIDIMNIKSTGHSTCAPAPFPSKDYLDLILSWTAFTKYFCWHFVLLCCQGPVNIINIYPSSKFPLVVCITLKLKCCQDWVDKNYILFDLFRSFCFSLTYIVVFNSKQNFSHVKRTKKKSKMIYGDSLSWWCNVICCGLKQLVMSIWQMSEALRICFSQNRNSHLTFVIYSRSEWTFNNLIPECL